MAARPAPQRSARPPLQGLALLMLLGWMVVAAALWWQHRPLLHAAQALWRDVTSVQPVELRALRMHRATGGGCGQLVAHGQPRHFVVTDAGRILLEPVEASGALADHRQFWREARRLCPGSHG
jgi:hypothetical protein